MEKNKKCNAACINLEFKPSDSASKQEKIRDFWKCLDSQVDLKPYEVPEDEEEKKQSKKSLIKPATDPVKCQKARIKTPMSSGARPKQKKKKETKEKKCDEILCKFEKYLREDLVYADSVEVSHEELYAEIEAYHKRLQRCGCKNEKCDCKKDT